MALIGRLGWVPPLLLAALAGCAAPRALQPAPAAAPQADVRRASIADVRQIGISGATNGRAGVDAVLAALRQPASNGDILAQEVVLVRNDGSATSVVERPPGDFQPGEHVVIIENGVTVLVPQN